jgi:UDP-N-acetylglucosamine--N-acetylmuramyl-(pentapeptide) pyrophosphoryl-undecaprenol N-acetylglucosamine transferase
VWLGWAGEGRRVTGLSVVIAGGGTGGHLFPGIAVAREIRRRAPGARVSFAGTARGLEATVVPAEGFELDVIRSAGLKGKSIAARLRGASLVGPSLLDAWRVVSRRRPHVVVGVGGYSSGPVVAVAWLRGVPTLVLEQNAAPGLTNRLLARIVRAAAVTYEETLTHFRGRGFVSGNPVREEFFAAAAATPATGPEPARRLLVLGGSQGAHVLNVAVAAAVPAIVARVPSLDVLHQTGGRDLDAVRDAYRSAGVGARAESFLNPVAPAMAAADLVICRAGATTLAELAASGRPAVLVPFAAATGDHQRRNARVLVTAGAAAMVEESELSGDRLASLVSDLLTDDVRRLAMARAMHRQARPDAAGMIVARLLELARA